MMSYRILLAGATGVIGRRLIPLLRKAGHEVTGTTRSAAKIAALRDLGAEACVVDVFDAAALSQAVAAARPEVVIHQLTDLPSGLDPSRMNDSIIRNARIRDDGTRNLIKAAIAAGARRLIAQSIAWAYAPGPTPYIESDPLDVEAEGNRAISVGGVASLEHQVLNASPLEGIILRYGKIYGPGTGADEPSDTAPLHVDAAAYAALLAIDHGAAGIYNIAAPNQQVAAAKARRDLGWESDFRLSA